MVCYALVFLQFKIDTGNILIFNYVASQVKLCQGAVVAQGIQNRGFMSLLVHHDVTVSHWQFLDLEIANETGDHALQAYAGCWCLIEWDRV